jgi:hypothetical protein
MSMTEQWRPVIGWEGLYEVSDMGRVRSLARVTSTGMRGGRVLKPRVLPSGYVHVQLCFGPERQEVYAHQLVAQSFLGPCPPDMEVRHGPAGKGDNRLTNLSYGLHIENCEDRARDGVYNGKLTRTLAAEIRQRLAAGECPQELAVAYGVSQCTISHVKLGRRWVS